MEQFRTDIEEDLRSGKGQFRCRRHPDRPFSTGSDHRRTVTENARTRAYIRCSSGCYVRSHAYVANSGHYSKGYECFHDHRHFDALIAFHRIEECIQPQGLEYKSCEPSGSIGYGHIVIGDTALQEQHRLFHFFAFAAFLLQVILLPLSEGTSRLSIESLMERMDFPPCGWRFLDHGSPLSSFTAEGP